VQRSTITKNDSEQIASITDLSGFNNTLNKVTEARKPIYIANDGGYPAIQFNQQYMASTNALTSVSEETIFLLVKVNAVEGATTANRYLCGPVTGNGGLFHQPTDAGVPQLNFVTGANTTNGVGGVRAVYDCNIGNYKVIRLRRYQDTGRDGYAELYENGLLMAIETHSDGTYSYTQTIGAKNNSTTFAGNFNLREYLHYTVALTEQQCAAIERMMISGFSVFQKPAWVVNELPQVQRYAIANNIQSAAAMPGGEAWLTRYWGDSQCTSFAENDTFDPKYIQEFTNSYIASTSTSQWALLNNTDTAGSNNLALGQGYSGLESTLAWELEQQGKKNYIIKYGIPGSTLANDGGNDNWNVQLATSNFPTRYRRLATQALNNEVCLNGTWLRDNGVCSFVATNDAVTAYVAGIPQNYTDMIEFDASIQGFENSTRYIMQIYSDSPSYNQMALARQYVPQVASAVQNGVFVDVMNSTLDTVDGTHANGAAYAAMANIITH
jgi:hypothetical protein